MKIEVVGVGDRRSGTAKKTGKPYDGTTIYGLKLSPDKDVDGQVTKEVYLNHLMNNFPVISVGDIVDVEYNESGFIDGVTIVN